MGFEGERGLLPAAPRAEVSEIRGWLDLLVGLREFRRKHTHRQDITPFHTPLFARFPHQVLFAWLWGGLDAPAYFSTIPFGPITPQIVQVAERYGQGTRIPAGVLDRVPEGRKIHVSPDRYVAAPNGEVKREALLAIDGAICEAAACLRGRVANLLDTEALGACAFQAIRHYADLPAVRFFFSLPALQRAAENKLLPAGMDLVFLYRTVESLLIELYDEAGDRESITDSMVEARVVQCIQSAGPSSAKPPAPAREVSQADIDRLVEAADVGDVATVRELLDRGVNPNARDRRQWPAIVGASMRGHEDVVVLLLSRGADPNTPGGADAETALMRAANFKQTRIVDLLLSQGARVDARDRDGKTALLYAAFGGSVDVVRSLVCAGADLGAESKHGGTAWKNAARQGHLAVLDILQQAGAGSPANQHEVLVAAAGRGDLETVTRLLLAAISPNASAYGGLTPLMWAAQQGQDVMVELLISRGADVDRTDDMGHTALMKASAHGRTGPAQLLISAGADVNAHDHAHFPPLLEAVYQGHEDVVRLLLENGANPNTLEPLTAKSVLTIARERGFANVARLLERRGAGEIALPTPDAKPDPPDERPSGSDAAGIPPAPTPPEEPPRLMPCARCGASALDATHRFCVTCGSPLSTPSPAQRILHAYAAGWKGERGKLSPKDRMLVRRWAAAWVDFAVLVVIASLLGGLSELVLGARTVNEPWFVVVCVAVAVVAYFVPLEGIYGATLGKLLLKIRVVNADVEPPGLKRAFLRTIPRVIEVNPFLLGGVPAAIAVGLSKK